MLFASPGTSSPLWKKHPRRCISSACIGTDGECLFPSLSAPNIFTPPQNGGNKKARSFFVTGLLHHLFIQIMYAYIPAINNYFHRHHLWAQHLPYPAHTIGI
jgi:hypothetical protein